MVFLAETGFLLRRALILAFRLALAAGLVTAGFGAIMGFLATTIGFLTAVLAGAGLAAVLAGAGATALATGAGLAARTGLATYAGLVTGAA